MNWAAAGTFVGVLAALLCGIWLAAAIVSFVGLLRASRDLENVDVRERMEPYTNVRVIRTASTSDGHVTQFPVERGDAS